MNITEVKVRRLYTEGRMRALVSITIDGDLAIHDIKVIEGQDRMFVAMPSRKEENGTYRDLVHPITSLARHELERVVLDEYTKAVELRRAEEEFAARNAAETQPQQAAQEDIPLE